MGEKSNKNKLVRTKNGRFAKKETAQNNGESYVEVLRENFKNPVGRPPKDAERQRTDLSIVDTRKASSRQTENVDASSTRLNRKRNQSPPITTTISSSACPAWHQQTRRIHQTMT